MSDTQWLLVAIAGIYLSDCVAWVRNDSVAVVIDAFGRAFVRRPESWASNDRGALVFTTILPARAVFVCGSSADRSFEFEAIDRDVAACLQTTRPLRRVAWLLFIALFAIAPAVVSVFGLTAVVIPLVALLISGNIVTAILFFRAHRRFAPRDPWLRWSYATVMLVATPSAIRAVDYATRDALRDYDGLAVAARVSGEDDPIVRQILREIAYPADGEERSGRYEEAFRAGLYASDVAADCSRSSRHCPRCLTEYLECVTRCSDCGIPLNAT